jgi:hypothetical protein
LSRDTRHPLVVGTRCNLSPGVKAWLESVPLPDQGITGRKLIRMLRHLGAYVLIVESPWKNDDCKVIEAVYVPGESPEEVRKILLTSGHQGLAHLAFLLPQGNPEEIVPLAYEMEEQTAKRMVFRKGLDRILDNPFDLFTWGWVESHAFADLFYEQLFGEKQLLILRVPPGEQLTDIDCGNAIVYQSEVRDIHEARLIAHGVDVEAIRKKIRERRRGNKE